jgi:predicted RNA binding protein YcfA (HicA-like mRNA interferase family)
VSVKRRELVRHLEKNGYILFREGARHSIFYKGDIMVPLKRRTQIDNITANRICRQAEIDEIF